MAKNYVQPGDTLPLIAPYNVASGGGFLVGSLFSVALAAALAGAPVEGRNAGVWDLPKTAGQAFVQGAKVYWDDAAKTVTGVAAGNTLIGVATQAAAGGDATARVKLGIVA
jgi:predicted RecA/RadA family phage recombinase